MFFITVGHQKLQNRLVPKLQTEAKLFLKVPLLLPMACGGKDHLPEVSCSGETDAFIKGSLRL